MKDWPLSPSRVHLAFDICSWNYKNVKVANLHLNVYHKQINTSLCDKVLWVTKQAPETEMFKVRLLTRTILTDV